MSGDEVKALSFDEAATLPLIQKALAEAEEGIAKYCPVLQSEYDDILRLRCYVMVSLGFERLVWREMK